MLNTNKLNPLYIIANEDRLKRFLKWEEPMTILLSVLFLKGKSNLEEIRPILISIIDPPMKRLDEFNQAIDHIFPIAIENFNSEQDIRTLLGLTSRPKIVKKAKKPQSSYKRIKRIKEL